MKNIAEMTRSELTAYRKQIRAEIKNRRSDDKRNAAAFTDEMVAVVANVRAVVAHVTSERFGNDPVVAWRMSQKPALNDAGEPTGEIATRYYVRTESGRRFRFGSREIDEPTDD